MKPFRLALIQMAVVGGDVATNVGHAAELIAEASASGAHIALLPECLDIGWTHDRSRDFAEAIPGGWAFAALAKSATTNGMLVCAGITERYGSRVFNSSVLISPDGELLAVHRKLNELDIGHTCYDQGDRLTVTETEFGSIGMMICADAFAQDQVISRSLGYMGADIILSPCAWAVTADHDNNRSPYGEEWRSVYSPVARAFSMPIVGVSNVGSIESGPWEGRNCIGCSLAIGSNGEILAQGSYGVHAEEILYLDIQTVERPARGCTWQSIWES